VVKKVVVVGGGVSGLLAGYVLNKAQGFDTMVIEANAPGGDFLKGGLKYIHKTPLMTSLLIDLGLAFTNHRVRGAILLKEEIKPYPGAFASMSRQDATRIQADHYRKTRRVEPDAFARRSMNDPDSAGPRWSLTCDPGEFVRSLHNRVRLVQDQVMRSHNPATGQSFLEGKSGVMYRYDYVIWTTPHWVTERVVSSDSRYRLGNAISMKLNIVSIEAKGDKYARWDYVYTPYTPEDLVHRISQRDGHYDCEFNGLWPDKDQVMTDRITTEMNFLFNDGWAIATEPIRGIPGHLLPMREKDKIPDNARFLGRFSEWDPRATTDVVFQKLQDLLQEWR
jgi:hypothetical protein